MTASIPLRPQSQLDQATKNYYATPASQRPRQVRFFIGGRTSISFCIGATGVSASLLVSKGPNVFLGKYYSEDLDTDPSFSFPYQYPIEGAFTYDEIIKRGRYAKLHGAVPPVKKEEPVKKPDPWELPLAQTTELPFSKALEERAKLKSNEKRKQLEVRLRMLDLQIEREKILSELAAL